MSSLYLVDGQRVYAPAIGGRSTLLHLAVVLRLGEGPWAGCGNAGRLDEDRLLFADETGCCSPTRPAPPGCAQRPGAPAGRGTGAVAQPMYR